MDEELFHALRNLLFSLKERNRKIIELRYGFGGHLPMTQKEVALIFNTTNSNISRIEKGILKNMRNELLELGLIEMSTMELDSIFSSISLYVRKKNKVKREV